MAKEETSNTGLEAFAKNLNGMQFQVYKSDGSSADSPLLYFINQIKEIFKNKETK